MSRTLTEQLADFARGAEFSTFPAEVVDECKRVVLDSIGCALGGVGEPKGKIGIEYGVMTGGSGGEATIFGTEHRTSVFGAAFANGELINALDFDAVLPPGHVAPYVLPGALAVAESQGCSGKGLIEAVAVAQEMTYRFGKSMDYLRDMRDGQMQLASVLGFTSTVFGAAAAVGRLRGNSSEVIANALGIAGAISPVNSHRAWLGHAPSATIKYTAAGPLTQAAFSAAFMAELGHRGDRYILDDADHGYRRFIGSSRWEPENLTCGLGEQWGFPAESTYKPYPHCRVLHAPLDALTEVVEDNDIKPAEIDAIRLWGEAWIKQPVWLNERIDHVHDAQFSIAHGISLGVHRVAPSPAWQAPELVFSDSVLSLMKKVTFETHPDYVAALAQHPSARPTRIEVDARGRTFRADRSFPKGSPSPDPQTYLTTDELVAKFRVNAEGFLPGSQVETLIDGILHLEDVENVTKLLGSTGRR